MIEAFLRACRDPALIEEGTEPIALTQGNYSVRESGGRVTLEAWSDTRNLARRVTAIARESPGKLELEVQRFGKRTGRLILVDRARVARRDQLRFLHAPSWDVRSVRHRPPAFTSDRNPYGFRSTRVRLDPLTNT